MHAKWMLVGASLLFALFVAELGLRLFLPVEFMALPDALSTSAWRETLHRHSEVPGLAYELTPNRRKFAVGTEIVTNRFGMRDNEPARPGTPGTCNIAALGDSFTFGFSVEGRLTWPKALERLLRKGLPKERVQVLNFGVGGYSIQDEVRVLQNKVPRWRPRLIVVAYSLNDPELDPIQPLQQHYQAPHWWQHLHVARLVARGHWEWLLARLGGGDYYRAVHAEGQRKWESVLTSFDEIADTASKMGAPVVVAVFPMPEINSWAEYPYADLHDQVTKAAKERGFTTIDLLKIFSQTPIEKMRVRSNDPHPSPLAHAAAASAMAQVIATKGLLACGGDAPRARHRAP